MKISYKLLMSALIAGASAFGAMAQDSGSVTITVDKTNGVLSRLDGSTNQTWNTTWTSNATNPGATFGASLNNMQWNSDNLDIRSGSALSSDYSMASTSNNEWYVSAYRFTVKNVTSGSNQTITAGDLTLTTSDEEQKFEVTGIGENDRATFTLAGPNSGALLTDFTITLSQRETPLTPLIQTTTITDDGEFAAGTNWYTIQIAAAGFYWTYVPDATYMALTATTTKFEDADLWCFTGNEEDGYQVYNKAAGTSMKFAAPTTMSGTTGGSAYALVKEPDASGYCYDWQLRETSVLGDDTPAFYMNEFGETAKTLNNRDNRLAFWSTGVDAGSAVQITWAEQTIDVSTETGSFYRFDEVQASPAWSSKWANDALTFGTVKNNMNWETSGNILIASGMEYGPWSFTTATDRYVAGYEFDYKRNDDWGTATMVITAPGIEPAEVTSDFQHLSVSGLSSEESSDFTLDATPTNANKVVAIKNFKVTLRRVTEPMLGTIVFRYDGTPDYNVCYRIPSITTIEAGAHKGRLLAINDYRYSGADIGNGRIDLYMSYSDDNGLTWSEPDHMRNAEGNPVAQGTGLGTVETSLQHPDCGFGDPAMVSDRESGKVLVVSVCGRTPFWSGRRNNPNQVARWYSEDGGDTWTEYSNITEDIYSLFDGTVPNGYIDSQFVGSGRMVQSRYIKVGDYYRVYAVMSGYHNASGNVSNWVLYTDDFGQSWNILGDPMQPAVSASGDEPKAEELPDGSVLLAARRNSGNRHFNIFRYTDIEAAEGNWAGAVATDMGMGTINACNGEIMILPVRNVETQEQCYLALQSFPYGGSRRNVSIAWKALDEAADIASPSAFTKWDGRKQISKMGSCYSTMCWQHDNTLGFLYEEETLGKAYCEIYRNLTIEDITDGAYEYCADTDGSVRESLTKELVSHRLDTEAPKGEAGEYVGQPDGSGNPEAEEAAEKFLSENTLENYLLFNQAIINGGGYIAIKDGGVYVLKSAHNGAYTFGDRYLTSNGTNLVSLSNATDDTKFVFVHHPEESDNWVIYHPATKTFVPQSPSAVETAFTVTTDPAMAHEYSALSTVDGFTSLTDVNPGNASYGTIHQGGNNNGHIVIWTKDSQASQWYMSFDHMATEDEMPVFVTDGIEEVGASDAKVRYFNILGREVTEPERGQFIITSDRKKVIF